MPKDEDGRRNHSVVEQPETFVHAGRKELQRLYDFYLSPPHEPFFTDISGPWPLMPLHQFIEHCNDESALWLAESRGEIRGFIMFSFIQQGLESAYLDLYFFDNCPEPNSPRARRWESTLRRAAKTLGVSRLELVTMDAESPKVMLAESWRFEREGLLRQHFFSLGAFHDLCLLRKSYREPNQSN